MPLKREFGFLTGAFIIIASMIGSGIFYLPSFILQEVGSGYGLILVFVLGGIIAITGSLSYSELASMIPEDGGEYQFLKKIFGHLPAFLTGWISLLVGFTASIAASAVTLEHYFIPLIDTLVGKDNLFHNEYFFKSFLSLIIIVLGSFHILGAKLGSTVQNILTTIKVIFVLTLIITGFVLFSMHDFSTALSWQAKGTSTLSITGIASALIMVMYVFSGWNGATYIGGEMKNPEKNLPRALFWGTFLTMVVYLLMNLVYITALDPSKMAGNPGFGTMVAINLFGKNNAVFYYLFVSIILMSSISAQLMIGPRVYYKMAQDKVLFQSLSNINKKTNTPILAILVQIILSIAYVFFVNTNDLFRYMAFALSVFPILTVAGLIYWRIKHPQKERPYKVFGYPFVPIIFILLSSIMLVFTLINGFQNPKHSMIGYFIAFAVFIFGIISFYIWKKLVLHSDSR